MHRIARGLAAATLLASAASCQTTGAVSGGAGPGGAVTGGSGPSPSAAASVVASAGAPSAPPTYLPRAGTGPSGTLRIFARKGGPTILFDKGVATVPFGTCLSVDAPVIVNGPASLRAVRCDMPAGGEGELIDSVRLAWDGRVLTYEQVNTSIIRDARGRVRELSRSITTLGFEISGGACRFLSYREDAVGQRPNGRIDTQHFETETENDYYGYACTVSEWRA